MEHTPPPRWGTSPNLGEEWLAPLSVADLRLPRSLAMSGRKMLYLRLLP
ncbi:MAG: hypothetical protein J6X88_08545 [Bacteroidales bacterium]|nr:hypothetical protein [Bacteroidales bacterium]